MPVSIWSILPFILSASAMGVGFVVTCEEIHSANKAKIRSYVMIGFLPLTMLGLTFMNMLKHIWADSSNLLTIMTIAQLAVFGFALGIGCLVNLLTFVERSSPDNTRWGFYMFFYVFAGIGLPLISVMNLMINLSH